jgi:NADH dehydrogenase (ubiquinone) 1 alpha subcomplex subunit 9
MQLFCRIQPVYVVDVAAAIINSLKDDGTSMGKTYELGGPDVYTVHELVIVTNLQLLL